ncbi:Plant basic secretory protein (BSP) family protein [Striga hermonthica]|uniref:Plant basic secretory protein (BSP) family protein n=1 Tax=Striga hermonthica TaxID=68872 RepID=A0A9N7NBF3_STRHE|nr:Plant basic secretory protein (BSP) family protein [Striga hermonthica]
MDKNLNTILPCLLLAAVLFNCVHAVRYVVKNNVPNTPGGRLFDQEIGVDFALLTMETVNYFIWKIFEQKLPSEIKNVPVLTLYISDFQGYAYKNGDNVNVSGPALDKFYFPRNKSKFFFSSLMYHEMTHVFQWHGNFTAPGGLTEGMADYVMVKSNIYEKDKYTKPGSGSRWDEGYGVTERFLEYCDGLRKGFTAALNKKMRYRYSDEFFVELLGKPVSQLWREYKSMYGNKYESASEGSAGTMFPGVEY